MKTVIEMAREAGFESHDISLNFPKELERFAELVRADEQKKWQDQAMVDIHEAVLDEREACAKLCGELHIEGEDDTGLAADLIRARSNK